MPLWVCALIDLNISLSCGVIVFGEIKKKKKFFIFYSGTLNDVIFVPKREDDGNPAFDNNFKGAFVRDILKVSQYFDEKLILTDERRLFYQLFHVFKKGIDKKKSNYLNNFHFNQVIYH